MRKFYVPLAAPDAKREEVDFFSLLNSEFSKDKIKPVREDLQGIMERSSLEIYIRVPLWLKDGRFAQKRVVESRGLEGELLVTANQRRVVSSKDYLLALNKRNCNAPLLSVPARGPVMSQLLLKSFVRAYMRSSLEDLVDKYESFPVVRTWGDLDDFYSKHNLAYYRRIVNDKVLIHSKDLAAYKSMAKLQVKNNYGTTLKHEYAKMQTINYADKAVNFYFATLFMEIKRRLLHELKDNTIVLTDMNMTDFLAKLSQIPYAATDKCLEADIEAFDKSWQKMHIDFLVDILAVLGFSILSLILLREHMFNSTYISKEFGIKTFVGVQQKSGMFMTFLGNTIVTMAVFAAASNLEEFKLAIFGGDDSIVIFENAVEYDFNGFSETNFNFRMKFSWEKNPTIFNFFLVEVEGYYYAVIDAVRLYIKFAVWRKDEITEERFISMKDSVQQLLDVYLCRLSVEAHNTRYGTHFSTVFHMLSSCFAYDYSYFKKVAGIGSLRNGVIELEDKRYSIVMKFLEQPLSFITAIPEFNPVSSVNNYIANMARSHFHFCDHVFVYVMPSGEGKSTLLRLLMAGELKAKKKNVYDIDWLKFNNVRCLDDKSYVLAQNLYDAVCWLRPRVVYYKIIPLSFSTGTRFGPFQRLAIVRDNKPFSAFADFESRNEFVLTNTSFFKLRNPDVFYTDDNLINNLHLIGAASGLVVMFVILYVVGRVVFGKGVFFSVCALFWWFLVLKLIMGSGIFDFSTRLQNEGNIIEDEDEDIEGRGDVGIGRYLEIVWEGICRGVWNLFEGSRVMVNGVGSLLKEGGFLLYRIGSQGIRAVAKIYRPSLNLGQKGGLSVLRLVTKVVMRFLRFFLETVGFVVEVVKWVVFFPFKLVLWKYRTEVGLYARLYKIFTWFRWVLIGMYLSFVFLNSLGEGWEKNEGFSWLRKEGSVPFEGYREIPRFYDRTWCRRMRLGLHPDVSGWDSQNEYIEVVRRCEIEGGIVVR